MHQVDRINVKQGKFIGKGELGVIFEGHIGGGIVVALKIQKDISPYEKQILMALKGKSFDHIIKVKVIAFEKKEDGFYTIMELGNILDLRNLSDKRTASLQMAKGVSELHQLGFFHRDLKPDNFVLGKDNKIKLIDFGTTRTIVKEAKTTEKETFYYMAPEVSITSDYDYSLDIWSLGIVFYEVFTNQTFFENVLECLKRFEMSQQQINKKISEQKNLEKWQKELLQRMIVQKIFNQKELNNSIKRIIIGEVITELKQAYEWKEDLYEILAPLIDIDVQIFIVIMELCIKHQTSDVLEFLQKGENQKHLGYFGQNNINKIINIIRNIKQHEFYKNNYSSETYKKRRQELLHKISKNEKIVQFFQFLVQLTNIDEQFIQCGSNSLNFLVYMKVDITNKCFENIRIKNTSLIGGNFFRCSFNASQFENVDIS